MCFKPLGDWLDLSIWLPVYQTFRTLSSRAVTICRVLHCPTPPNPGTALRGFVMVSLPCLNWFPVSHSFLCLWIDYIYRPDSRILLPMCGLCLSWCIVRVAGVVPCVVCLVCAVVVCSACVVSLCALSGAVPLCVPCGCVPCVLPCGFLPVAVLVAVLVAYLQIQPGTLVRAVSCVVILTTCQVQRLALLVCMYPASERQRQMQPTRAPTLASKPCPCSCPSLVPSRAYLRALPVPCRARGPWSTSM